MKATVTLMHSETKEIFPLVIEAESFNDRAIELATQHVVDVNNQNRKQLILVDFKTIDDDELDKINTLKEWIKKQLLDIEREKDSYMVGYRRALKDMIIEIERVEHE